MFHKILASLLCATMLFVPQNVNASPYSINFQDHISIYAGKPLVKAIQKGEVAAFDGVLLNTIAAAEVQTNVTQANERCDVKIDKEVQIIKAEYQYKLDVSIAKELAATERNKLLEEINEKQRELYTSELKSTQKLVNKRDWGALYFVGGVVGGMLIILAGAYAVKEIRESP